jgi:L-ribulose-5-phosphate 3-epimerase
MKWQVTRRDFLSASAAVGAGLLVGRSLPAAEYKTRLYKSLIGKPTEEVLSQWKAAGFEGIESNQRAATVEEAAAARKVAEQLGMKIHSVLYGWANFNSPDPAVVDKDIAAVESCLRAAQAYGADAVLLVPCRTGVTPIPQPWEFDIEFDAKTSHVKRVVAGDNAKYEAYMAAQNQATDASRKAVERLIPTAEKCGVVIALENVWNNLWVKPALAANFIASFDSPWVKCYYDVGNHVKYAPPEEWIRALGKLIVKVHIKDFQLNPDGHGGKFVHPRDGSVNWPSVRQELEKIGYNGWLTIEDGGLSLDEFSQRLDLIIAGK